MFKLVDILSVPERIFGAYLLLLWGTDDRPKQVNIRLRLSLSLIREEIIEERRKRKRKEEMPRGRLMRRWILRLVVAYHSG